MLKVRGAKRRTFGRALATTLVCFAGIWSGTAYAQTAQGAQPPEHYTLDANNVDVVMGTFNHSATDVAIGPEDGGLAYSRITAGDVQRGSFDGLIEVRAAGQPAPNVTIWAYTVSLGGESTVFQNYSSSSPTATMGSESADGSTLTFNGVNTYTLVDSSGTVRLFSTAYAPAVSPPIWTPVSGPGGRITQQTRPNGERQDWHYRSETVGSATRHRIQSVTNNRGYQIKFEYAFNGNPTTQAQLDSFGLLTSARGINNAVDYCAPAADTCSSFTQTWPVATYARSAVTGGQRLEVTNSLNETTAYTYSQNSDLSNFLTEIDWAEPGRASTVITYSAYRVATYSEGGATWTYVFEPSDLKFQDAMVTDPNGNQTLYHAQMLIGPPPGPTGDYITINRLKYILDPVGARTDTVYDGNGRLTAVQFPEGNRIEYTYDTRGNITQTRRKAKPAAPASDLVVTAAYPATCTNPVTCNKPTSITVARGAVTDFTYNATHGGILTETAPAPYVGAARPQTRHTYQQQQAWYRTSSGSSFTAASPIWLPVTTSACATGAPSPGCAGTANEVKTTTGYQAGSSSIASNLLPVTSASGAGNGSLTATTTTTWDHRGDVRTVDGPLPGTADTTWHAYDAVRRQIGMVGPDPDGGGALAFPATRTVYDADGLITSVQQGTTTGQSDAAFAAFSQLSRVDTVYDSGARKVRETQVLGSGTIGLTQYAYDPGGRLLCTAVRMNPAAYGSLPSSACTLGTPGSSGADRITRNTYDDAGQVTVVTSAYGTPLAQATQTKGYTSNGQVDWIEDANGNRSDYTYDGFDRLLRLNFPYSSVGAHAANPNDFEQYGYDANDNVVSRQLRNPAAPGSAPVITNTYDALDRQTVKTLPGGGTVDDVFYTYDNLGRRLAARFSNPTTGDGVTWTWDALGRQLTETASGRTLTSQYDLAGRRTRLTWPAASGASALYIDFTWDLANRLDQVRENGATSGAGLLANYAYDNLGRRTGLTRGNTTTTAWAYVANSRDWSMTQNLVGSGQDLTQAYALSPAAQIKERTLSNTVYSYTQPTIAQAYARDGLNRYTAVAGAAFGYDGRGNLTADGARNYAYDLENRLTTVSGASGLTLTYDPLGRLRQTTGASGTTQFLYDGDRLVGEYTAAGAVTARYAHGIGPNEPLVWYEGATLIDRRWLHADSQGSIVAVSGATGSILGLPYRYSPYGEPDANYGFGGGSRFRYTGQISLGDTPLWHYKARAYAPGIGRFLQTDPVGYEDQMNLYAYVGNDPVNLTDPTGMAAAQPQDQRNQEACDADCREATNQASSRVDQTVGTTAAVAEQAARTQNATTIARGAVVAGVGTTIMVEGFEGMLEYEAGVPLDVVIVDHGAQALGSIVGGVVGANVLAAEGSVVGGPAGGLAGAAAGAYGGAKVGEAGGAFVGETYRRGRERAGEFLHGAATALDNLVARASGGYRPYGT